MNHPSRRAPRPGFTLLEVALAAIVGILVIYGALESYEQRKQSAGDAIARERVTNALGTVASYTATNGKIPASGTNQFANAWSALHPDEKSQSPWGGSTGDPTLGVSEDSPLSVGSLDPAAAPDVTSTLATNGARQSNLYYVSLQNTANYVSVTPRNAPVTTTCKSFVLSIYDASGNPWLTVVGGK